MNFQIVFFPDLKGKAKVIVVAANTDRGAKQGVFKKYPGCEIKSVLSTTDATYDRPKPVATAKPKAPARTPRTKAVHPSQAHRTYRAVSTTQPHWRNGITSYNSYLVAATLAASDVFTAVMVRKFGSEVKVKFFPSIEAWGYSADSLADKYGAVYFATRFSVGNGYYGGYQRMYIDRKNLAALLGDLGTRKEVKALSVDTINRVLSGCGDAGNFDANFTDPTGRAVFVDIKPPEPR